MPRIYLSPSLQEGNPTVLGISEEELMNRVADAMEPYLRSSGIEFTRNRPDMTLSQVIACLLYTSFPAGLLRLRGSQPRAGRDGWRHGRHSFG